MVDRIEGRLQEFLDCKDYRLVSTTSMCAPYFEVLVTADCMQFEQTEPGRAVLKVLSASELSAETKARLTNGIRAKTQGGLEIEGVRADVLPRTVSGKHRLLVQELDAKNCARGGKHRLIHVIRERVGRVCALPITAPIRCSRTRWICESPN